AAYEADVAGVGELKEKLDNYKEFNTENFNAVAGAVVADNGTINTISGYKTGWNSQSTQFDTDTTAYNTAVDTYNKSLAKVINDTAKTEAGVRELMDRALAGRATESEEAISDINTRMGKTHGLISEAEGVKTFNGTKSDASTRLDKDGNYVGDLAVGTTVEDHLVSLDNAIGRNADAIDKEAATREAEDGKLANAIESVRQDSAATLKSANAYTDKKVDTLEKNVSGGIAAATALSAVEVSNVKKGEMSVGAGYGYYNGQSAAAFGTALGISDSWSVNAGAGIAQGDETQFSIRAGANYKFKLF
nr:YadA C-terminal domain-containing protein [Candidatus Enterousia merdequi]